MSQTFSINLNALATVQLTGIMYISYNEEQARWEIVVPHLVDYQPYHVFIVDISKSVYYKENPEVDLIEIKVSEPANDGYPRHPKDWKNIPFSRTTSPRDNNDWRWITDLTNQEIPHGKLNPTKPSVRITRIHVYNGMLYTNKVGDNDLICATQSSTAPIIDGIPMLKPDVGNTLDQISNPWGRSAIEVYIDIEPIAGGYIDVCFDSKLISRLVDSNIPYNITISNTEPPRIPMPNRETDGRQYHYGLGDLYQYYKLFEPVPEPYHLWQRSKKLATESLRTGDCNPAGGSFYSWD